MFVTSSCFDGCKRPEVLPPCEISSARFGIRLVVFPLGAVGLAGRRSTGLFCRIRGSRAGTVDGSAYARNNLEGERVAEASTVHAVSLAQARSRGATPVPHVSRYLLPRSPDMQYTCQSSSGRYVVFWEGWQLSLENVKVYEKK